MRALVLAVGVLLGLMVLSIYVEAGPNDYEAPASPLPIQQSATFPHYDVQVHSRDPFTWGDNNLESMMAQHGPDCSPPPATHENHSYVGAVFACNNHLMTSMNASGYGEIMLTPSQLLNCSAGCTLQWDMSTEKMSGRDWPDVWLTPWSDNLALPIEPGLPDLQGIPRRGIQLSAATGHNSWLMYTIANFQQTGLNTVWWEGMHNGIAAGTNQAATRQTFKLTITPGRIRLERLASATATNFVWYDGPCACLLAPDYVVQFGHHSYTPTKDGAGVPATWHWFNPSSPLLSPSLPFTLIHSNPRSVSANNSLVTFNAPAPADAMLRFSAICKVSTDASGVMAVASKQTFLRNDTVASYFIPVQQGRTSVSVSFAADDWYGGPCHAKDFHVWSKGGSLSTPTPTLSSPTPLPTATMRPVPPTQTVLPFSPTPTSTPLVTTPTSTLVPSPSPLPTPAPLVTTRCYSDQPSRNRVNNRWVVIGPEIAC